MQHDCDKVQFNYNTNNWMLDNHVIRFCPFCGKDLVRITCKNCKHYDYDDELLAKEDRHPRAGAWKHKCRAGMSDRFSCTTRCKSCYEEKT